MDGACLWDQSGCSVNQNFASFWFRTPPHLPLCALLFSCSPLFRYSFYADQVQHRKYRRLYLPIGWLAILISLSVPFCILQELLIISRRFCVSYHPPSYGICSAVHICTGYKERKSTGILLAFTGLLAATISVMIEGISTYFVVSLSGIFVGIGMMILFSLNVLRTAENIHMMELRRQKKNWPNGNVRWRKYPFR